MAEAPWPSEEPVSRALQQPSWGPLHCSADQNHNPSQSPSQSHGPGRELQEEEGEGGGLLQQDSLNNNGNEEEEADSTSGACSPDPEADSTSGACSPDPEADSTSGACSPDPEADSTSGACSPDPEADSTSGACSPDPEADSTSEACSPDLDKQMKDTPSSSPSPTEGPMSPEDPPQLGVCEPQALPPSLGSSLQELLDQHRDHPLLPLYLHQIAEACAAEEDYERALRLIQLERVYHQRLLSNLAALQERWVHSWRVEGALQGESNSDLDSEHLDRLGLICSTHTQPVLGVERCDLVSRVLITESCRGEERTRDQLPPCSTAEPGQVMEQQESSTSSLGQQRAAAHFPTTLPAPPSPAVTDSSSPEGCVEVGGAGGGAGVGRAALPGQESPPLGQPAPHGPGPTQNSHTEQGRTEGDAGMEEGVGVSADRAGPSGEEDEGPEEVFEEDGDEEEVPTEELEALEEQPGVCGMEEGVPLGGTDTLDDLARRIQVQEISPAPGLVSILKTRASPEGSAHSAPRSSSKRKVRFREPDDTLDPDEVGGDSWLLLLLLCLATVVISVGGTALYCTVGDAQSSVCRDFSHNVDFYVSQVQRGIEEVQRWFSPGS